MTPDEWPFCYAHNKSIELVDRSAIDQIVNILKTTITQFNESLEMFFWQLLEKFSKLTSLPKAREILVKEASCVRFYPGKWHLDIDTIAALFYL